MRMHGFSGCALESENASGGQSPLPVVSGRGVAPPGRFFRTPPANGPQRRFGQPASPPIPGRASTSLPPSPDIALQRLCPRPHWPRLFWLSTNLQPATCNPNLLASRCCSRRWTVAALPPRRRPTPTEVQSRPRRVARVETKNHTQPAPARSIAKSGM